MPMQQSNSDKFGRFAKYVSNLCGRPGAFSCAFGFIVVWALSGPLFGFSETWQLVVNTSTTIVTFLMVFLIQHTQNKDTNALQIKLDEVIRATKGAHNALLQIEEFSDKEIEKVRDYYSKLGMEAHKALDEGQADTNKPEAGLLGNKKKTPSKTRAKKTAGISTKRAKSSKTK